MTRALLLLLVLSTPVTAKEAIGVYKSWGAFAQATHCYAIARALTRHGKSEGFVAVGTWPDRGLRASLSVHLGRAPAPQAPVTLTVGDRRFALLADARDAFAVDAATDRAIVAAMRQGRSMSIEAVAADGRPFADVYRLSGAATAIDAAALACRGR